MTTSKIVTPVAQLTYIYLGMPDPEYGDFKVTAHLDPSTEDGKAFVTAVRVAYEAAVKEATASGKKVAPPPLRKSEAFEGFVQFKSRTKFEVKTFDKGNLQFDSKKRIIFTGSTGRLCVTLDPFKNATQGVGLALRLSSVQVHTFADAPAPTAPFSAEAAATPAAIDDDLAMFGAVSVPSSTPPSEAEVAVPPKKSDWDF